MAKKEKKDETPQLEPQQQSEQERLERTGSYITVFFEAPGSANVTGLRTQGVSLNQVALAARELQSIVDFEQWWSAYSIRMQPLLKQLAIESAQKAEEEMVRRILAQGGGLKPN